MKILIAANDDGPCGSPRHPPAPGPMRAEYFPTAAARHAWLDALPDWDGRRVRAWPTYTRLLRAGKMRLLGALLTWWDLTEPIRIIAANDNEPADEGEQHIPPSPDCAMEEQPSIGKLARAWSRVSVVKRIDGSVQRSHSATGGHILVKHAGGDVTARIGDVYFGPTMTLDSWQHQGKKLRPVESYRGAKRLSDNKLPPTELAEGLNEAEDEIIRVIDAAATIGTIPKSIVDVLDHACTSMTAIEIAPLIGIRKRGKAAERAAVREIDAALESFLEAA